MPSSRSDATARPASNALLIEHRQQTARLYAVEQLARDVLALVGPSCWVIYSDDGEHRCVAHNQPNHPQLCPYAALLERARALGLAE